MRMRIVGFAAVPLAAGLVCTGGVLQSWAAAGALPAGVQAASIRPVDVRPASARLMDTRLASGHLLNARPAPDHPGFVPAQAGASGAADGSVLDGVFTADQASRGEATFRRVCSACHDTGEFSGGRFRLTWVGRTTADLFDTISTLMPEGDPGSLSPAEYASVVAYLLQVNGYPAGEAPLPASLSALRGMEIVEAP